MVIRRADERLWDNVRSDWLAAMGWVGWIAYGFSICIALTTAPTRPELTSYADTDTDEVHVKIGSP